MRRYVLWLMMSLAILGGIIAVPVGAINVTYDRGDTWLSWTWNASGTPYDGVPVDVYVNGILHAEQTRGSHVWIGDLAPDSTHELTVWENSTTVIRETGTTLPGVHLLLWTGIISLAFIILGLLLQEEVRRVLCAVVAMIAAGAYSLMGVEYSVPVALIGVVLVILAIMIFAITVFDATGGTKDGWS